jgi:hypothetical protein
LAAPADAGAAAIAGWAARCGSHASHPTANSSAATLLRGSNGSDRKGGRYLAAPAAKKLPGKKKPPTLTLKRGKNE